MTDYSFGEMGLVCLCGAICGHTSARAIRVVCETHLSTLQKVAPFKKGLPSWRTIHRFLTSLPSELAEQLFLRPTLPAKEKVGDHIAIDGKALRGSPTGVGTTCLTVVSAFDVANTATLAVEKVSEKSNEIKAIEPLLEKISQHVDLKEKVLTLDAMGTQKTIVQAITEKGADAVIGLKGNQEKLFENVLFF